MLVIFSTLLLSVSYGQTDVENENTDELKILKNITPFNYINQNVKTLKIPKRKYDSPFFCDELIDYKDGFIVNSITSYSTGSEIEFMTNFFYYNLIDKSIKKISVSKADTIESIVCSDKTLYYSFVKNGKRNIGYLANNQCHNLFKLAPLVLRNHLETAKWIKLGFSNDKLFVLSPNFLFEVFNNEWKSLVKYSLDDFYIQTLKYRKSNSMLPTKNIIIKNNSVYFLQEIVQGRESRLLKLNITNGSLEDYFVSLDYIDYYFKEVNDFTFLNDSSLLVLTSRLMDKQLIINTKDDKVNIWAFDNHLTTLNNLKVEFPVTSAINNDDTLILASSKGLFYKHSDTVKPLVYFTNYHQKIKVKVGANNFNMDFNFEPRSIKKLFNNIYVIGGMWGGLYQVDILNNKLTCLDDVDYDKIKSIDLSEL